MHLEIHVFWHVMLCCWVNGYLCLKNL